MYEPIYWHTILHKIEELNIISLPTLRIKGQAPQCKSFSLERSRDDLSAYRLAAQVQLREEGVTSSSSSYISSNSLDSKEEEGEKVVSQLVLNRNKNRVILVVELEDSALLISISSSNNELSNDLAHAPP